MTIEELAELVQDEDYNLVVRYIREYTGQVYSTAWRAGYDTGREEGYQTAEADFDFPVEGGR